LLAPVDGAVATDDGGMLSVTRAMTTVSSVLYDAVVVPDGEGSAFALASDGFAVHFVAEAYKHAKTIAAVGAGVSVLDQAEVLGYDEEEESGASAAGSAVDQVLSGHVASEPEASQRSPSQHRLAGEPADEELVDEEQAYQEMADADLTGVDEDLAGEITDEADIVNEADALLDTGIVIDSEAGVDFLAALLAAVAAHRHFHRPVDAIAA
jgi:putative intracellular protease/amidase